MPTPSLQASIPVSLALISLHEDEIKTLRCPSCAHPMDLHQPDSGFPDRMLWTCEHCATWFLMDIDHEKPEAVLVCLPDQGHFLSAIRQRGHPPDPPDPSSP